MRVTFACAMLQHMFEIIATICLVGADAPCRDMLLPGYEAKDRAACEAQITTLTLAEDMRDPRCAPVGNALEVQEVAPGVFVHLGQVAEPENRNGGDVSNSGFVIGQSSVAVIDTGGARWLGEAMWRAIRARTDKPVSHVILTHMHPDHVFGADALRAGGAQVVGHMALPRALADRQSNYIQSLTRLIGPDFLGTVSVPIDITVPPDAPLTLNLGGRPLVLKSWPAAHTGNDLTVLDQVTGTLFVGDLVFDDHAPALDGDLVGWRRVLAELSDMSVERVIPGHGGPVLNWPAGGADQARYLQVLEADTRAAIDAGERLGDAVKHIAQTEAKYWSLFDAYNPRNATQAFTDLEWD